MSLITPDFGLLFWMTLIFAIVFFILAKFGFPVITKMVRGRQERIETSIRQAKEIEARVEEMAREHAGMLEETRREQARILREATEGRKQILEQAREDARGEAQKIVDEARARIAEERESALRDIRREVALLSVEVAEQIVRKELSSDAAQADYLNRLVDEAVGKAN
ncbi:MAG: F0F1 ATP synthase subunit B [Bacteroidales bacterium]|jgi:F-type H+-transporting ATPase subunit b|nr:F0F1 ATP synthase subunit B [Bacteroidales bacterium]